MRLVYVAAASVLFWIVAIYVVAALEEAAIAALFHLPDVQVGGRNP